jgi:hypothetical protein
VTLNSASGVTPQPIITAPAGFYLFVLGIQITIDPTCTIAAAGMANFDIVDSEDGNIAVLRAFVPASATLPTVPTVNRQTSAPGAFWGAQTAGSSLTGVAGVALTAGSVRMSFNYGFSPEPFLWEG